MPRAQPWGLQPESSDTAALVCFTDERTDPGRDTDAPAGSGPCSFAQAVSLVLPVTSRCPSVSAQGARSSPGKGGFSLSSLCWSPSPSFLLGGGVGIVFHSRPSWPFLLHTSSTQHRQHPAQWEHPGRSRNHCAPLGLLKGRVNFPLLPLLPPSSSPSSPSSSCLLSSCPLVSL